MIPARLSCASTMAQASLGWLLEGEQSVLLS